ncbi:hypothetical protein BCR34DRAFT_46347 [Clohesyomyces aquaticus]|uniref:Uncharacterized protein n=1 Tax=Clohesyomyces aquaticus TaxID=1231657 RepID=A0A1Y1Z635_9PLEO|nr:hypothetical protein BCR34DRAFT_46347 [Clohesyomyces aquaticus]
MAPSTTHASDRPLEEVQAPTIFHPHPHEQSPETAPPRMQSHALRWTFWASVLSILATFALALIILIAGTKSTDNGYGKASHTSIFLERFKILDIPIKYPFLCGGNSFDLQCHARWTVKMYLNGVWAEEEVEGDYVPSHLLWKGVCKTFNLTTALTIMDNTLALGGPAQNTNYTTPTDPTVHVKEMTPVETKKTLILFILGIFLTWTLFPLWAVEGFLSGPQRRRKLLQRRWIFCVMGLSFAFYLSGAAYITSIASKAAAQVAGDSTYIATNQRTAYFGSDFQGLLAGVCALHLLATGIYAIHSWLERRLEKRSIAHRRHAEERESVRVMTQENVAIAQDIRQSTETEPPPYTAEPTELERIRLTELASRARLESSENR